MLVVLAIATICLGPPVNGPVIRGYSPAGQYAGHWGVDYAADVGEPVRAPASGRVTFAGSVAGMRSITIEPVPGFKVSVSYLAAVRVAAGDHVTRGMVIGAAGAPHGVPGVHLSTRIDGRYVDPAPFMGCKATDISRALRLVTPPRPYPRSRAHRNPRRDVRPDPRRPSPHRGLCAAPTSARPRAHRPGR
jgi:murein DD-endopeptidase MepM/ murein hydrolase activator NlpD